MECKLLCPRNLDMIPKRKELPNSIGKTSTTVWAMEKDLDRAYFFALL